MNPILKELSSVSRVGNKLRGEFVWTFIAKIFSSLGGVLFSFVVAWLYGAEFLGSITFWFSLAVMLSIFTRTGLDVWLCKWVARNGEGSEAEHECIRELIHVTSKVFWLSMIVVCLSLVWGLKIEIGVVKLALLGTVPFISLLVIFAAYYRGRGKVAFSSILEIGFVYLLVSIILLVFHAFGSLPNEETVVVFIYLTMIALLTFGVASVVRVGEKFKHNAFGFYKKFDQKQAFSSEKYNFFLISLSTYLTQVGMFVVIGPFLTDYDLGLLRIAERLALLVSFPLLVVGPIIMPKIAYYSVKQGYVEIRKLIIKSVLALIGLTLPVFLVLITFQDAVILRVNSDFLEAADYVVLLAVGQLFTVVSGPFGMFLFMGDREKEFASIQVVMLLVYVLFFPFVVHVYGPLGFVIGFLLISIVRAFVIVYLSVRVLTPHRVLA